MSVRNNSTPPLDGITLSQSKTSDWIDTLELPDLPHLPFRNLPPRLFRSSMNPISSIYIDGSSAFGSNSILLRQKVPNMLTRASSRRGFR